MIRSPEGVDGSLDMNDLAEVSPAVHLRAVEDDDLDVLFSQQADPVAAAMAAFPARDREQFDTHWARIRRDDTVLLRTILADGVIAGNIGSWQAEGQRLIGYWTGRQYWGRGVATHALALLLDEEPTRPVYAHVATHNAGSMRVLQKCGFERDLAQEAQAPEPEDGIEEFIFVLAR